MSDENNKQAVADPANASAQPDAAAAGAQDTGGDELDKLLADYANGTGQKSEPAPSPPVQQQQHDDVLRNEIVTIQRRLFRNDMNDTIKAIRGDLDPGYFDDAIVRGWIEAKAEADPRLGQAWAQREQNPAQFKKVVAQLGRDFAKHYGRLPDKAATEDREAVTAAVRGASTRAPEGKPPRFGGMTNQEYNKTVREQYGFDPGT